MLFGLKQITSSGAGDTRKSTGEKPTVEVYVATDMSPIEQVGASDELRAAIQKTSHRVQELFGRAMNRASGE